MKFWAQRERALQILSKEVGFVTKPHGNRLRIALAFPNTYWVGMSNLGFQTMYRLFNAEDDVVCERFFLPPKQELAELVASKTPLLTLESQTPVGDFDVIAFSVSFEWDYVNVLTLLRLAGVPRYAAERTYRHPLVVVGGAVTFVNPEPLAPFADVIAAGEGEALAPALSRAFSEATDRGDLLRHLARKRGFYIPSFYEPYYAANGSLAGYTLKGDPRGGPERTARQSADTEGAGDPERADLRTTDSDGAGSSERAGLRSGNAEPAVPLPVRKAALKTTEAVDPPATGIFTPDTEFGARFLVEVVRGCANLCRFCWAGYNYLPVRAFPTARILELARAARPHANRAGLVSIALCDHPDIEEILVRLNEMGYAISPASLRLDDLTPTIVRLLRQSGERTITIAPETGSDRLRRVINKTVTNDQILDRAELIFASGLENLKLYYMIGLPTETDDDLVAIRDLTLQIRERMLKHARSRGQIGRIVGSVNPLIPKPGTAYQWLPMEDPAVVERKIKRLRTLMADIDNVYFNIKSERHSYYQALLSLGDRRVALAIDAAERNGQNWRAAVAEADVDGDFFIFRDRSRDAVLPWDIIDGGMKRPFFEAEYAKSLRAEWTLPPKRAQENTRLLPVIQ